MKVHSNPSELLFPESSDEFFHLFPGQYWGSDREEPFDRIKSSSSATYVLCSSVSFVWDMFSKACSFFLPSLQYSYALVSMSLCVLPIFSGQSSSRPSSNGVTHNLDTSLPLNWAWWDLTSISSSRESWC